MSNNNESMAGTALLEARASGQSYRQLADQFDITVAKVRRLLGYKPPTA